MLTQKLCERQADRFIPCRSYDHNKHPLECLPNQFQASTQSSYTQIIRTQLMPHNNDRILTYSQKEEEANNVDLTSYTHPKQHKYRQFGRVVKMLDIPDINDDFYLNGLDWNHDGTVAIALNDEVFLYTPQNLTQLCKSMFSSYVSSLKFRDGIISVAHSNGIIDLFDLSKNCVIRTIMASKGRISSQCFMDNTLLTGSKGGTISAFDIRQYKSKTDDYALHHGEVCALKEKGTFDYYFASGANDNSMAIWDLRKNYHMAQFRHQGAVKGLAWCPWRNGVIASGGGTGDKTIRVWNSANSSLIASTKTKGQISGLLWNQPLGSLVSCHGFNTNEISAWNLVPQNDNLKLEKEKTVKGHRSRILNMVQSHNGSMICTTGADETLKFWAVNESSQTFWEQKEQQRRSGFRLL